MEDMEINECYYTFSNEEFDDMLKEMELKRYNSMYLGSETTPAIQVDPQSIIDSLDSINSMATSNEKLNAITKTVYDIAMIPSEDRGVSASDGDGRSINSEWILNVVTALVKPLIKSILTPQVILLFIVDFKVMGLVNLDNLDIKDIDTIINLFYKKILSMFISLVKYIKDKITEFLMDLFYEYIAPLLVKVCSVILLEQLNDWIRLLNEAMACLPSFNAPLGQIDNVNYADIIPTQNIPENNSEC